MMCRIMMPSFIISMTLIQTAAYKYLVIPPDHHSNANFFAVAGGALKKAGHEVHFLTTKPYKKLADRHGLEFIQFQPINYFNHMTNSTFMYEASQNISSVFDMLQILGKISYTFADLCHEMLQDEKLQERIASEKYDLAVVDGLDFYRCMLVIPYKHDIRYVSITPRHDPWKARVSASPAAEGVFGHSPYPDPENPTFLQRFRSVLLELVLYAVSPPPAMSPEFFTRYAPDRPATTMQQLFIDSEIVFTNLEIHCLDTPRVSAPHYIYLGGLGNEPARPLEGEAKTLADNAKDGVIVVTFGSAVSKIPLERMNAFLGAFGKIPQTVFMRYDGDPIPDKPANVHLMKWLPQNDLLGHPNTKLFITHGGANGQMEALYHGIPLISLPFGGDQNYNADRAVARGYGTTLTFGKFTSDELISDIKMIISNPEFKRRIASCSERYRAMPDPKETFTFWVEHVTKFGGDHLKPPASKFPFWKFMNLDVLFVCFIMCHLPIHIVKFVFRKVKLCIVSKKTKTE